MKIIQHSCNDGCGFWICEDLLCDCLDSHKEIVMAESTSNFKLLVKLHLASMGPELYSVFSVLFHPF